VKLIPSPSLNCEERRGPGIDMIVLHYTGMATAERARAWLCDEASKVSSHYLVDEEGEVFALVGEDQRAWHAGVSCWAGESDINSCSIGIEIHNLGHAGGLPEYPDAQIEAVMALCSGIMKRHGIARPRVLAHSDVAPGRKIDPGEHFPWERLARAGIGLWAEPGRPDRLFVVSHPGASLFNEQQGRGPIHTVEVFDLQGRLVNQLADRRFPAGDHRLRWDGSHRTGQRVPRGIYFYRVSSDAGIEVGKIVVRR